MTWDFPSYVHWCDYYQTNFNSSYVFVPLCMTAVWSIRLAEYRFGRSVSVSVDWHLISNWTGLCTELDICITNWTGCIKGCNYIFGLKTVMKFFVRAFKKRNISYSINVDQPRYYYFAKIDAIKNIPKQKYHQWLFCRSQFWERAIIILNRLRGKNYKMGGGRPMQITRGKSPRSSKKLKELIVFHRRRQL